MRAAGVETIVNSDDLAIMGIVEVGRVFCRSSSALSANYESAAIQRSPDAVILVDWPEFNLRLASALHRRGLKVIYYISPQLWAWRPRRVSKIKRDVDLLLSILPFEVDWYKAHGVDHVEFVGHPLSGEVKARFGREEFCRRNDLDPARPIVSFLPGSRQKEVERILPPMLDAIEELRKVRPEVQAVVVVAPSRTVEEIYELMSDAWSRTSSSWSNNKHAKRSRFRCRSDRQWYRNARSGTARNADGCCLQGVGSQLAHAWAADHGATLRTGESRGGERDRKRTDAGSVYGKKPGPGITQTPRPRNQQSYS